MSTFKSNAANQQPSVLPFVKQGSGSSLGSNSSNEENKSGNTSPDKSFVSALEAENAAKAAKKAEILARMQKNAQIGNDAHYSAKQHGANAEQAGLEAQQLRNEAQQLRNEAQQHRNNAQQHTANSQQHTANANALVNSAAQDLLAMGKRGAFAGTVGGGMVISK